MRRTGLENCTASIVHMKIKNVGILMDEVHIRDDLVYDKHEGNLVGFVNVGDINNHLLRFEAALRAN